MEGPSYNAEVEGAYLAAYDEFADPLYRFILMKTSSTETAHDLLQETFIRAWEYCRAGNEVRAWKPFLYRTAYNLIVDLYRKKKSVSLDVLLEAGVTFTDTEHAAIQNRAEVSRVRAAIDTLDETYKDVVILRYIDDLPPKEIAQITGLSENVVSVRIHRGLQKLRELLKTNTDTDEQ